MNDISILCCGDFAPCRRYEPIARVSRAEIFGDLCQDIRLADIAFLNLETPLCLNGTPIRKSGPCLRAHPECIEAVAAAGFEVVSLANNHIFDYGEPGLRDTLSACARAGIRSCGAGMTLDQAQEPLVIESKGLKIGILAVAEREFSIAETDRPGAAPLDPVYSLAHLQSARSQTNILLVSIHGGNEYFPLPRPGLRRTARFFIEQGADGVICHHPHVSGAYEIYLGKPIFYSLGNLIFDHTHPPPGWSEGYAVRLRYSAKGDFRSFELYPYQQSVSRRGVQRLQDEEKCHFLEGLNRLSAILVRDESYEARWTAFCEERAGAVLISQYAPFLFRGIGRLAKSKLLRRLLLPKNSILRRENLVACESHNELLLRVLRLEDD